MIGPCDIENGNCAHQCSGDTGDPICSCDDGYKLADDGKNCEGFF